MLKKHKNGKENYVRNGNTERMIVAINFQLCFVELAIKMFIE